MTIDHNFFHPSQKPSVAIIGGGVSGLTAAYLLRHRHEILVLEKQNRIGGHANTIHLPNLITSTASNHVPADLAVDTGFIVYNNRNYPLFSALLEKLNVTTKNTDFQGIGYRDVNAVER